MSRDHASITIEVKEVGGQITLQYYDDGPGFPEEVFTEDYKKKGVGSELINGIVSHSLGGKVIMKNKNGAITQIIFKNELKQSKE